MLDIVDQSIASIITIKLTIPGKGNIATSSPRIAMGSMQYPITLTDWKTELSLTVLYPLLPSSLQLIPMRIAPSQKMMNTLTKLS